MDERGRVHGGKIHHGEGTLPAGEKPRLDLILCEQRDCRIERRRSVILEFRRLHRLSYSRVTRTIAFTRKMIGEELSAMQGDDPTLVIAGQAQRGSPHA